MRASAVGLPLPFALLALAQDRLLATLGHAADRRVLLSAAFAVPPPTRAQARRAEREAARHNTQQRRTRCLPNTPYGQSPDSLFLYQLHGYPVLTHTVLSHLVRSRK